MKKQPKVIMYASNFSKYGEIQAMRSTLEFLAADAGFNFFFVNDPQRERSVKVNYGGQIVYTGAAQSPAAMNACLEKLVDQHAV